MFDLAQHGDGSWRLAVRGGRVDIPGGAAVDARAGVVWRDLEEIGWLLLVILTPLWVNLWGQQPFELPKVMLMRTLVWALAGLAIADASLSCRSLWREVRANPVARSVGLLALVIGVTAATAVDRRLSLWGSYERAQGAVTFLTYLLLFLLAAHRLRPLSRAWQVVVAMAAASAPLVLFSLAQALGWNPFGLLTDARSPIYATLGRANFVGAYLVIVAPLTLALLLSARRRGLRRAWAALLAGQLLVIVLTGARSAWLGLVAALAFFALLWWGPRIARSWRRLAWGGVGMLALGGPLGVLWLGRRRLGSTAARLTIWQGVLALIRQRPLLGYGADALGMVFPSVYAPELVYYQGRDVFVDRAHNVLLDWAVMAGIPGVLALCAVLVTFGVVAARALRSPDVADKRTLLIAVLTAVLGNLAGNLVSFDVTPTATATWLLMGIGVSLATPPAYQGDATAVERPRRDAVGSVLLFVGIAVAVGQFNLRPLLADTSARAAIRYAGRGDDAGSIAAAERAVAQWPVEPAHHLALAQSYWQQAVDGAESVPAWLQRAEAALSAARRLRPGDPIVWLHTAQFYTAAAREFGSDTRGPAGEAFRQALALAPNYATIYTAWGRAHLDAGEVELAAPLLRQAVRLDATSGEAYVDLGAVELALGRPNVALADYQEAVRLLPASGRAHAGLANCYWALGRFDEASLAVEAALQRDPRNAQALGIRHAMSRVP